MGLSRIHVVWIIIVALAAALIGLFAVPRVLSDEAWKQVLKVQLLAELKCEAPEFVEAREFPLGGEIRLSGKVRCLDGRMYDFNSQQSHQKFDIRACAPSVC
jgi:hypothetical protein